MEIVKMGIIGVGNMGSTHSLSIIEGRVPGMTLTAVADRDAARRDWAKEKLPDSVKIFEEGDDLIESGLCDAVIVATPHYQHPVLAIKAMGKGLHVPAANTARSSGSTGSLPTGTAPSPTTTLGLGGPPGPARAAACC